MNSQIISNEELLKLLKDFYGSNFTDVDQSQQQKMINAYRKVESETNEQIKDAGGVKNWYASGQGRLLNL